MEPCPCSYYDEDAESDSEDCCACGHVLDEHDDLGACLMEIEP